MSRGRRLGIVTRESAAPCCGIRSPPVGLQVEHSLSKVEEFHKAAKREVVPRRTALRCGGSLLLWGIGHSQPVPACGGFLASAYQVEVPPMLHPAAPQVGHARTSPCVPPTPPPQTRLQLDVTLQYQATLQELTQMQELVLVIQQVRPGAYQ